MSGTLARRLLVRYALTVVAVLAILAVVLDRTLASRFLEDLTASLVGQARAVRTALPEDPGRLQATARSLGRELGVRVTVIRPDGVVLADSSGDPATFENHVGRPEVRAALSGRTGVDSRTSESVGEPFRYVALPPKDGLIVRLALPLSTVEQRLAEVRVVVALGTILAAAIGVAAVWIVARGLTRPLRRMTESVRQMSAGNLRARVAPDGAHELALLSNTLNRMAEELGSRIDDVRRDRARLEQILEAMDEGVMLVEADDRLGFLNPAARRILGALAGDTGSPVPASLRDVVREARDRAGTVQRELESGVPARAIVVAGLPVGYRRQVLLVLRDVTAARRIEAMRRDFVADASHELKTPAAAIGAAAETVQRAVRDDPEAAERFAGKLHRDAERLSRIVSDLLDLSRLEAERPAFEAVRLDRVVGEQVEAARGRAAEAGVRLDLDADATPVRGSAPDLRLLVGNLLDNAIRYSPPGGRVRVAVASVDGEATITVADTGIGIPARDLPRVFERFYRVDRARSRETGGTGLGLSIARHVAERHGGRIEVESELGRGSTFRVLLPAAAA